MPGPTLEKIIERLRDSGQLPRFAAPAGASPPAQLKSPPGPPRRMVGRRELQRSWGEVR
jgi:hypothetical protein